MVTCGDSVDMFSDKKGVHLAVKNQNTEPESSDDEEFEVSYL